MRFMKMNTEHELSNHPTDLKSCLCSSPNCQQNEWSFTSYGDRWKFSETKFKLNNNISFKRAINSFWRQHQ